jgi:hypothetical protein
MEYAIVGSADAHEVAENVQKLIEKGWEPLGGVSCGLSENEDYRYVMFAQAMIKRS